MGRRAPVHCSRRSLGLVDQMLELEHPLDCLLADVDQIDVVAEQPSDQLLHVVTIKAIQLPDHLFFLELQMDGELLI